MYHNITTYIYLCVFLRLAEETDLAVDAFRLPTDSLGLARNPACSKNFLPKGN